MVESIIVGRDWFPISLKHPRMKYVSKHHVLLEALIIIKPETEAVVTACDGDGVGDVMSEREFIRTPLRIHPHTTMCANSSASPRGQTNHAMLCKLSEPTSAPSPREPSSTTSYNQDSSGTSHNLTVSPSATTQA